MTSITIEQSIELWQEYRNKLREIIRQISGDIGFGNCYLCKEKEAREITEQKLYEALYIINDVLFGLEKRAELNKEADNAKS